MIFPLFFLQMEQIQCHYIMYYIMLQWMMKETKKVLFFCKSLDPLTQHSGTHLSIEDWWCISEQRPNHEFKGTACRARRQDCCTAQIWERLQRFRMHWRISKAKWPPYSQMEEVQPNWAIEDEGSSLERWPRTWWLVWPSSRDPVLRWYKVPEALHQSGLYGRVAQVCPQCKTHESLHLKDYQTVV